MGRWWCSLGRGSQPPRVAPRTAVPAWVPSVRASILTGDCRELLRTMPAASFDCVIADPPYGETSLAWDRWPAGWLAETARVLKPTGSLWVFGSMRMFLERAAELAEWRFVQDVVWEKHNGSGSAADRFRRVHEHAAQFRAPGVAWADVYKQPVYTKDATARTVRRKQKPAHWGDIGGHSFESVDGGPRLTRSVIYARSAHGTAIHPTQKPVEIVLPLLEYSCPVGGLALDPFFGSGTTGIACKMLGIQCVGIEIDSAKADAARARLADDAPLFAEVA